jgi:hypothetical protein
MVAITFMFLHNRGLSLRDKELRGGQTDHEISNLHLPSAVLDYLCL